MNNPILDLLTAEQVDAIKYRLPNFDMANVKLSYSTLIDGFLAEAHYDEKEVDFQGNGIVTVFSVTPTGQVWDDYQRAD
jgi:hypothetical protein